MQGALGLDRALQLLSVLVAELPDSPEDLSDKCGTVLEAVLQALQPLLTLANPLYRARAVGLVKAILHAVNVPMTDSLMNEIIESLVERLDDKVAETRKLAAAALGKCAAFDEDGELPSDDPVVVAFGRLLHEENALGVRAALVTHMPLASTTIDMVIAASLDTAAEVRAAVFTKFTNPGVPLAFLT